MFILWAVEHTIIPRTINEAPTMATYRRPIRSEIAPTKGHIAARESKFAKTNHIHRSLPPMSPYINGGMPPTAMLRESPRYRRDSSRT